MKATDPVDGGHDDLDSVGEALIRLLEQHGVDTVFGIPGVHTIELYRGLAASGIRHVTPRHEQGAAFMADGYARTSGKPGVCLLITGPGLTNALTGMAQARADRIPMLVISGVNARETLGRGRGHLHELPDQAALAATVALRTFTLDEPGQLVGVLEAAFATMRGPRPGPVHVQIPTDVMTARVPRPARLRADEPPIAPSPSDVARAKAMCAAASRPLILAGGGAARSGEALRALAERLDAPVVTTVNARGLLGGHPLELSASPSLAAVRALVAASDLVLALGTELGPTDTDLFGRGALPAPERWIRVDVDPAELRREPLSTLAVRSDVGAFAEALGAAPDATPGATSGEVPDTGSSAAPGAATAEASADGAGLVAAAAEASLEEIGEDCRALLSVIDGIWRAVPGATLVGDSTQLTYAGNLLVRAPRARSWFNSATGYGTLGYAPPAAIGAALADPARPVVCLVGDGGLQFSLAELGSARDEGADVAFLVWNNRGYREIETSMRDAGVAPVGVTPSAPDFVAIAGAYGLPARRVGDAAGLETALAELPRPCLVEFEIDA